MTGFRKLFFVGFSFFLLFALFETPLKAEASPDLDLWLINHPEIAEAIRWYVPNGISSSPNGLGAVVHRIPFLKRPIATPSDDSVAFSAKRAVIEPSLNKKTTLNPSQPPWWSLPTFEKGAVPLHWDLLPAVHKQKIRDAYKNAWTWLETCWPKYQEYVNTDVKPSGFDTCYSTAEPAGYPPANIQLMDNPPEGASYATVITSNAAFDLFAQMVGLSLALEIKGKIIPGTIEELSAESREEILDGTKWFRYVTAGASWGGKINKTGYLINSNHVIPAPALLTFSFLAQNKLIGTSKLDTVTRVFTWERDNMSHFIGKSGDPVDEDCPYDGTQYSIYGAYWGYPGKPPLSRVINGTVMSCHIYSNGASYYDPNIHHWTYGCSGSSGFNQQVFRVVNIPAQTKTDIHSRNNFIVDNNVKLWIGHSDDTYGLFGYPEIPIAELLIPNETYESWIAQNIDVTSRQKVDLVIKYLPKHFLRYSYCNKDEGLPPDPANADQHDTYKYFKEHYTLDELNNMYFDHWGTNMPGVFENMDAKIASLGGCSANWPLE